ncbi:MAG: tetratricopeptide repeat protein [Pseudomonadota bacterium]
MRSQLKLMASAALCAVLATACVTSEEPTEEAAEAQPFIDPVVLANSRCGPGDKPLLATPSGADLNELAAGFDFDTPFALPDDVVDHFHYPISTDSDAAQHWFDTGLAHMANFNHDEAIAAFRQAQTEDPACAICYWGEGLSFGSNINAPFEAPRGAAGRMATDAALELIDGASETEAALITALDTRYSMTEAGVVENADAFADAMEVVSRAMPADKLVLALAAESNMDTQPWNYWEAGARAPYGRTARTLELLETALQIDPEFAPAIHLYIHITEASVDPFRAEAYADRLHARQLGVGHLLHMPSHTYLRLGKWRKTHEANIAAIAADEAYIAGSENADFYAAVYYPHNVHFVVASSQMAGNGTTALDMSSKLPEATSLDPAGPAPFAEHIAAADHFTKLLFADDAAVLAMPEPAEAHLYLQMARHYARGVVYARQGDLDQAKQESAKLSALAENPIMQQYAAMGIPLPETHLVADLTLKGKIEAASGDLKAAIKLLDEAADRHAQIPYFEPTWWYYPTRQTLGAYLLMDGQYDRAEREFFRTLIYAPNNAYALYGLAETFEAQGDDASEAYARKLFDEAWMGETGKTPELSDL